MKTTLTLTALVGLLLLTIFYALAGMDFSELEGGGQISGQGMTALALGALATLAIGGGLMFLLFYSHRRGYDEAADRRSDPVPAPRHRREDERE